MKISLYKILLSLSFILSITISIAKAQKTTWDSTYRPGIYAEQVQKFKAEGKSKSDIVFLGNSITAGTDWSKLLKLPEAKNRGISGDITFGVLERLQEVIDGKPSKAFILIGINDISRNVPDSVILENYKKMVSRIRKGSKRTKIFFYTMLPVNASFNKFKNHYGKDEHILFLNAEIRKFTSRKVTVIDLYPAFLDQENRLKAELTKDGLHLLPEGYELWARILADGNYLK